MVRRTISRLFPAACILNVLFANAALAQILTPQPDTICRRLTSGDRFYPEYRSCCDIDGGHSRWVKADGSSVDRILVCALWGLRPADPALNLNRPPTPALASGGIPAGRYSCTLVSPVRVDITSTGQYTLGDGSSGRFELTERGSDHIGSFSRYKITGGSFDGFFFLHRDNGQLQLGRQGWTRCESR